ncbi:MAG: ferrochelatase [Neisseriaceae bacterium]
MVHQSPPRPFYGVLLVNVGTPNQLSQEAVKKYLKNFLSDRRIVEWPPLIWQPILRLWILKFRTKRSLAKYQSIWHRKNLSPLLLEARQLKSALQKKLSQSSPSVVVELAMSYSEPHIPEVLASLQQKGIQRVIILPLFPQYSATTVGACLDQVWKSLLQKRFYPQISTIHSFYNQKEYLKVLVEHIKNHWSKQGQAQLLLVSFHGIPLKYAKKGDPYLQQCYDLTKLLQQELNLSHAKIKISFQSLFGPFAWPQPSTDSLLKLLPEQGINSVDVISPGFMLDCLETLEELDIRARKIFLKAGGKVFHYIPCLNHSPALVAAISKMLLSHISA